MVGDRVSGISRRRLRASRSPPCGVPATGVPYDKAVLLIGESADKQHRRVSVGAEARAMITQRASVSLGRWGCQNGCARHQGSQPGLTRMTFRFLFDTYGTKPAARAWVYALAMLAAWSA